MPKEFSEKENKAHCFYAMELLNRGDKKESIIKKLIKKGYTFGHAEYLVDVADKTNFIRDWNRTH